MDVIRGRIRNTPTRTLVCLSLAGGLAARSPEVLAQSQPGAQAPAEYQQLIDRGLTAYAEQRPAEARSWFAQAHAPQPGARTLRALGVADLALDNYTMARDELEAALKEAVMLLADPQRTEDVAWSLQAGPTHISMTRRFLT